MQACIQPAFTWSHNHIFAGGEQKVALLIEWRGVSPSETGRVRSHKIAARDIELRIWLEPHVLLTGQHGCRVETGDDHSYLLPLGTIHSGHRRFAALEFTLKAAPPGCHDVVWLQWLYRQPPGERIRELPVQKLSLEYTLHTGALQEKCCFHVEKHLEFLMMDKIFEEAALLKRRGLHTEAREIVRRHADKLLLLAARSGDMQLLREAENMYRKIEMETLPLPKFVDELEIIKDCI